MTAGCAETGTLPRAGHCCRIPAAAVGVGAGGGVAARMCGQGGGGELVLVLVEEVLVVEGVVSGRDF